ncbi:MAG TPA: ABC transporter permease [Streptosporangiaceae bacterium]|jgi:ABC-2 type transport system permease protein|nr:ABC transporter permease [Streptosporangiaceae bacterium]
MTATIAPSDAPDTHRVPLARGYRFELVKQLAQWRIRLLILACWIGPALAVIVVSGQATLPSDTLFGRWMHATGWAGALVVLGFAGSWFFPLLTSVVAGDVFSAEDRLGTWRHLLVAVRSPRRIFVAKALASFTVLLMCLPGLAVSGIAGGLVVGSRPLTGLDGHLLSPADAAGKLLLAWLCVLAPILAFAAIGLLASVIFGRSPIGLLLPAFGGLGMQLASQVLSMPVAVRLALPSFAFLSWNGLFTSPPMLGPMLTGIAVSLAWAVTATALAYVLFMRRDFTSMANDGSMRRAITFGILPLLGVWVLSAGVVAAATGATGSGIDASKLQRSLATSFAHLYRVQSHDLNHLNVTEAQLRTTASCTKGQGLVAQNGPGNDWRCYVYWHLPDVKDATGQAIYQLDVNPNGRYVADGDGPNEVNGYFVVHTPYGDAPNPLWQFDGLVDLLSTTSKG